MNRQMIFVSAAVIAFLVVGLGLRTAWAQDAAKPVAWPKDKALVKGPSTQPVPMGSGALAFAVKDIDGKDVNLADYRGKVVLIVNVASKCGNTPQYKGLEAAYEKYKDKGFVIVGFPANNFHGQEPGSNEDIKTFCTATYDVKFPMMSKISVLGDDKAPLYKFLTEPATDGDFAGEVDWNFAKFLVDRNGNVVARFSAKIKPEDPRVVDAIEKALAVETPSKTASAN